jgi:replicative DNA helicase
VDIDIKPGRENIAEVIVAKHRQGATGIVDLFFRADNMSFHNVEFRPAA